MRGSVMTLEDVWDRLRRVRSLSFVARSASPTGWNGRGSGTVAVETTGEVLVFSEQGTWRPEGGRDIRFSNVFRWTKGERRLRMEHLRFGIDHPVYLFDLEPAGEREWRSASPHVCSEDCYAAEMQVGEGSIVLRWSVNGPRKREEIEYVYSW
jgi:hypothetical protein